VRRDNKQFEVKGQEVAQRERNDARQQVREKAS